MTGGELGRRITPLVEQLYPQQVAEVCERVSVLAEHHAEMLRGRSIPRYTHETVCLITYGDALRRVGEPPLRTLAGFLRRHLGDLVSDVHLLPIFPWTSDDGFAVVDHRAVDPAVGTWADVADLAADYGLVLDLVANHTSSRSPWFLGWLAHESTYRGFYIERDDSFDTSRVVRPRTTPLFHPFPRPDGSTAWAWTTFGADQVDVDVRTPAALLELTDVLLGFVQRGAAAVRLDAIGFLWKESGTPCLHLAQTHAVIKLWRTVVDAVAPGVQLLTETNVPHADNVSYFGDGRDEANLVYQFALPPLVLHSFVAASTARLSEWATLIDRVSSTATWFNFLASHDGIGLRATEGILDDASRAALVARTRSHGGRVSMATQPDGSETVYELNVGFLDALCTPAEVRDPDVVGRKALAAHSILLSFVGVPAIYYHSLFGSPSDQAGMRAAGVNRRINRAVLDADRLSRDLRLDPRRRAVFDGLRRLLGVRRTQPGFSPYADQQVELLDDRVLALRRAVGTPDELLSVTNVTAEPVLLPGVSGFDVVSGSWSDPLRLGPWGFAWLRADERARQG
jgi:sucrose phosphorylase